MWIVSFVMGDVDPLLKFGVIRKQGPIRPFVPSNDGEFERLYGEAAKASSLDIRVTSMKQLSKYVQENNLVCPLFERKPVHFYDAKKISSLGEQDGGYWFYLERLELLSGTAK